MAILPTRILEWEFDAGVWTDVSADLVAIGTARGRNRELGRFDAGNGVITLRNDTRKYDPENAAGPYYGKLRPNRRIRMRATYNAITYPVIVGYVDRITQQYGGPNDATAEVTFTDLFKLLGRVELPSSAYAAEVLADSPSSWWRLGEPAGSTVISSTVGGFAGSIVSTPTLGTAGLVVRDGDGAMTVGPAAGTNGAALPATAAISGSGAWSIEFLMRMSTSAGNIYSQAVTDTRSVVVIYVDSGTHKLTVTIVDSAGFTTSATVIGTTVLATGVTYHVVVTKASGAGAVKVYIDGADVTSGSPTAPSGSIDARPPYLGLGVPYAPFGNQFDGIIDDLAVYPAVLSAARVAAHNSAARTPWNGDTPGTRLGRILDIAAVPSGDRNLDAGNVTLQSTSLGGDALTYAQKIEETELGELFVTRDGKVRLLGRNQAVTGGYLTPAFVLVDADSGVAGIAYRTGGTSEVAEDLVITRSTVSREGSVAIKAFDLTAKAEFGWLDDTHAGLLHDNDDYSLHYAQWMVNSHKAPASHIGALMVDPAADPANAYPAVLGLEIGDQVTYKRKPQNSGAVISAAMRVEAIAHETGAGYWRTRLQLSPFGEGGGLMPWILGDTTYSVLGTTTRPGL